MGSVVKVGLHEVEFMPPQAARVTWVGDVNAHEARTIALFLFHHVGRLPRASYVTDVGRLGKMPPDACEALVSRPARDGEGPFTIRLAFAGANARTKMIMTLLMSAAGLASRDSLVSRFFTSVDDAIAWAIDDCADPGLELATADTTVGR